MGKRGPKPGTKYAPTLAKEQAREVARALITRRLEPMITRQIAHAMGIGHLYTRDKAGKFTKIENEAEIERLLTQGVEDEHYWIFAKDPSTQAFTDLMNRALDKPKEQEMEIRVSGALEVVSARLKEARKRLAHR